MWSFPTARNTDDISCLECHRFAPCLKHRRCRRKPAYVRRLKTLFDIPRHWLLLPVKDKFQHFTLFLNPSGTATVLAPAIRLDARRRAPVIVPWSPRRRSVSRLGATRRYSLREKIKAPGRVDCRSNDPTRKEGTAKPAESAAGLAYIGGTTPFAPTTTKLEARAPSEPRSAGTNTGAPAATSARMAGAKLTTGVSSAITIFASRPW
jgi:hypothetical protein